MRFAEKSVSEIPHLKLVQCGQILYAGPAIVQANGSTNVAVLYDDHVVQMVQTCTMCRDFRFPSIQDRSSRISIRYDELVPFRAQFVSVALQGLQLSFKYGLFFIG
jgi:hypothetical protein